MANGPSTVERELFEILRNLAADVTIDISPYACIIEATKEGTAFHFRIPRGKPTVIAFEHIKKIGRRADVPRRPCVTVGIRGDLLTGSSVSGSGFDCKPNASYRSARDGGPGEWQIAVYETGDTHYRQAVRALAAAARECLRRAGVNV